MINHWLQFAICASVIVFAGSTLTRSGATVSRNTGIGSAWIGALMLPLATSLPELVTTIRAVSIDAPNLALGNILGSCLFNLSLLAVIDLLEGRGPLAKKVDRSHIIIASLSTMTVSLAAIAMLGLVVLPVGWIGLETIIIALAYIFGSRLLFRYDKKSVAISVSEEELVKHDEKKNTTAGALIHFGISAIMIIIAGILLTDASDAIALETGLGHTFTGSIFLAISTSLPETVTTITAVRLGLLDMAVANVFGANFMNLFIVFIADLFYRQGPLLSFVSNNHIISALLVIIMSSFIILGMIYRSGKSFLRIGYDVWLVLACYLLAAYLLFKLGGNY